MTLAYHLENTVVSSSLCAVDNVAVISEGAAAILGPQELLGGSRRVNGHELAEVLQKVQESGAPCVSRAAGSVPNVARTLAALKGAGVRLVRANLMSGMMASLCHFFCIRVTEGAVTVCPSACRMYTRCLELYSMLLHATVLWQVDALYLVCLILGR